MGNGGVGDDNVGFGVMEVIGRGKTVGRLGDLVVMGILSRGICFFFIYFISCRL